MKLEIETIERNLSATEPVLMRLQADITASGAFGASVVEVTADEVRTRNAHREILMRVPIAAIRSVRCEPLIGGARLVLVDSGGRAHICAAYTKTRADQFAEMARGILQIVRGESLSVELHDAATRCPRCSRLLPEKEGVCPACVRRGRTLLRIVSYMRPYMALSIGLAALSVTATAIGLAPPWIQGELIDKVLLVHRNLPLMYRLAAIWLAVILMTTAIQTAMGALVARLSACIAADLRARLYTSIQYLQLQFFDKKQVGAITSRVTQDTDRVWEFLVEGAPYFITNLLMLVGVVLFLVRISLPLTLWILSPVPVVVAISGVCWKPVSQLYHRLGQKWARFHTHLNESLSGIRVVKAFAQEPGENEKFMRHNAALRMAGIAADTRWQTMFGCLSVFTGLGVIINWVVGGRMVFSHQLSLGDFWKVNAYLILVYGPLQWFAMINNWFTRAMAGAERIFEIMDMEREPTTDEGEWRTLQGDVEFCNVQFGYDKANPVLKGLSFTARKGEMIGLVGKSGAGKSTTINLISRFYEPDSGTIKFDGDDYRTMPLRSLRRQIGVVLQDPFLFNGTIAENIRYGKPGASLAEVVAAARTANAHAFILTKPEGYDSMIGEKGVTLSGGERQRISIARAILHDPRILILDEATSSVDVETERQIQEALARLVHGRTTFAIAHRLSTLRNATRLIVLDRGELAEMGTHAELMEKGGSFSRMVAAQSRLNEILSAESGAMPTAVEWSVQDA
ncbi:MAG: ABC transporter ATP-binding protein [Armatimonadetes bacterium]|nr:ABC transporter ATP-binding protein [Armatimonadota bacterium]MDE2206901.1 ABC transporter ATP-binding protein [Armatimonadota bacterium]